jgi:putative aldouronate transport system substrate-binding protein
MMKRNGWKFMFAMMALLLFITACSSTPSSDPPPSGSANSTASPAAELKPVELVWYIPSPSVPADLKTVEEEVNKIIKSKINATVKMIVVAFGDYTQKMNTVVASGEKADIMWTSNWNFDYVQNQSKGAFLPLDEWIDKLAPDVKKSMPQFIWDATKIGGKIYGVPNYQTVINKEGFIIQKRFVDKYKLDLTTLKKLSDLEPMLKQVKEGEKAEFVYAMNRAGNFGNMSRTFNLEPIVNGIAYISLDNPDKVVNVTTTPGYREYVAIVRDWYLKGYINQDAATLKAITDIQKAGKAIFGFHNVLKPGGEAESKVQMGGNDVVYIPTTEAYAGTNTIITTMQAINAKSPNADRAMMLINLVNTDKTLFNLLTYGVEGKHYTKNTDNTVKLIPNSGYAMSDWALGNVFNGHTLEGKDPKIAEETKKSNETAKPSPIMGFKFQAGPVSSEIANVTSVNDEYGPGFNTGTIDAKDKMEEYQAKLKAAGIDKIIAEVQKQLDEWKKTK